MKRVMIILFVISLILLSGCGKQESNTLPHEEKETRFLEKCLLGGGSEIVHCIDSVAYTDGTLEISLCNLATETMANTLLIIGTNCEPQGTLFERGQTQKFTCKIPQARAGEKFEEDIKFVYEKKGGVKRTIHGQIILEYTTRNEEYTS